MMDRQHRGDPESHIQKSVVLLKEYEAELHLLHVERLRAARSPCTLASAPASYGKAYLTATAFSSISI